MIIIIKKLNDNSNQKTQASLSRINIENTFASQAIHYPLKLSINFDWLKQKTSSRDFIAFALVAMLHLTVLFGILPQFNNNATKPVLSFTVTMMDVATSSSKIIASTASVADQSKLKAAKKIETNKANIASATKAIEQNSVSDSKVKSLQSHDSIEQTAVVAPTTKAIFDSAYLNNPSPNYPNISRRLKEQGIVNLDVFVNTEGVAQKVVVIKSSGFNRLDLAALETVKRWRFSAAKNGDALVASWVEVPINFVLE